MPLENLRTRFSRALKNNSSEQLGALGDERVHITIVASDMVTDAATGTAKAAWTATFDGSFTAVMASATAQAPTGADFILDVNRNGTTIFPVNKPTIPAGKTTSKDQVGLVMPRVNFVAGDIFTVDFDQVGSANKGRGIQITLIGTAKNPNK